MVERQEVVTRTQRGGGATLWLDTNQLYALATAFIAVHPDARSAELIEANHKVIDAIESIERR